jgi:hypothetical protein
MNFGEDFLCDLFCIVAIAQDAEGDVVDLGCIALHDLTESRIVT